MNVDALDRFACPDAPLPRPKRGLAPITPKHTRGTWRQPWLLILGSAPSVLSLQLHEYYGNPKNHFWGIMDKLCGYHAPADSYAVKMERLAAHGICVWDVCAVFERHKSSDATLQLREESNVQELLDECPTISCIACNGKEAYSLFCKSTGKEHMLSPHSRIAGLSVLANKAAHVVYVPSSSPANAMKNPIATKARVWKDTIQWDSRYPFIGVSQNKHK